MIKKFLDKFTIDSTKIQRTDEGFLIIPAFIARTGIQLYSPEEGGRLYRPPSEVFSEDSRKTMIGKSITKLHPRDENNQPDFVNPKNWKMYEVGSVIDMPEPIENKLFANLMIKDAKIIKEIEEKIEAREDLELSCGYSCDTENCKGCTEEGEEYDGIMRNIRYNHLSIVPKGRAGSQIKMLIDSLTTDNKKEVKRMKINFFDTQIDVIDADVQSVIKIEADMKKKMEQEKAKFDSLDSEKKKLEEKLSTMFDAEQVEIKAKEMAEVKVICDGLKIEGKEKVADMKAAIVEKMIPDCKAKYDAGSEDYKSALFDSASELAKKHIENNKKQSAKPDFVDADIFDESKLFS